jgi:phenylalanyl-tRNA synthetase alpha chain
VTSSALQTFLDKLQQLENAFEAAVEEVDDPDTLENIRVTYLGRRGSLVQYFSELKDLPEEDKPEAGKTANKVKQRLQDRFARIQEELRQKRERARREAFDPTLPGRSPWTGSLHPVTLVSEEICAIFRELGYEVATGPEVETDFYNFEALNIPQDHPARDMQDTLYISDSIVLRTHTSPLQIRTMQQQSPPLAAVAPGKVYRRDADLTHSPMFNQIEGFLVDTHVSMADLRGTLTHFLRRVFNQELQVRFRPSFFPFTEPSAEVDISCVICSGKGYASDGSPCRVCKQTGFVEILGCGMIDPEVFKAVDYDPEEYTGFAFGLGVERIAMLKYGIDDLRLFFDNDLPFLDQFQFYPAS